MFSLQNSKRHLRHLLVVVFLGAMICVPLPTHSQSNEITVEDIFGRRLNDFGLVLVDWEGYMANPAIKFFVSPPGNAAFPATAVLSASSTRLYFDLPSEVGANGPTK